MKLCRPKLANMLLNMLQKPAEKGKKRPTWSKNSLLVPFKKIIYCASTGPETFVKLFGGVRTQIVDFSSEFASKIKFKVNKIAIMARYSKIIY